MTDLSQPMTSTIICPAGDAAPFDGEFVDPSDPPLVSFCIPTHNNEATIRDTLQSFEDQEYPHKEIVVVDNGSTDLTVSIVEEFTEKIYIQEGPIGRVRQRTVEEANGEILGLFDSDIVLPSDEWLTNAVQYFNYDESISTVWPENVAPPETAPTTRLYFELWHVIENDRMERDRGPFGGGNALFRRDALEAVGGIDESLHYVEDLDWAVRLQEAGYKVIYLEDPIYHHTMLSFEEFARKQFMATENFTRAGGDTTGLSISRLIYEQVVLGTKGMVGGLLLDRDPVWLLFPAFFAIRSLAFVVALFKITYERISFSASP